MADRPMVDESAKVVETPRYRIERRGDVDVLVDGVGCRPATPAESALWAELAEAKRDAERFACKARASNTGANDPQDCNWPFCGCDPYANKVMDAIEESGFPIDQETPK